MRRKWLFLAALLVLASMLVGPWGYSDASTSPPKRVAVSADTAKRFWLSAKNTLPDGRVTITVSNSQVARLEKEGLAYTEVPARTVSGVDWRCWFSKDCDPWGRPQESTTSGSGNGQNEGSPSWLCWVFTCKDGSGTGASSNSGSGTGGPVTTPNSPGAVYRPPSTATTSKRSNPPITQIPYGLQVMYGEEVLRAADIRGGSGIKVAILDSGYFNHMDFTRADGSSVILACRDYIGGLFSTCQDGNGHGTHLAGIVAGAGGKDRQGIYGVAPDAGLLIYKVIDQTGTGYADDIAQAIRDAADAGANIILIAFGGTDSWDFERQAIDYAAGQGCLLIAAAGRMTDGAQLEYPAKYPAVVSVGPSHAWYFSVGSREPAELNGPAYQVLSTAVTGKYTIMTGTSQAAAYVAGLAAKVWQGSASATQSYLLQLSRQGAMDKVPQLKSAAIMFRPLE